MITAGCGLKLDNGNEYTVEEFGMEINEVSGNYWCFVTLKSELEGSRQYPVWMIVEMLNKGIFTPWMP